MTLQLKTDSFWSNNYFEYESNSDRNETLSVGKYLIKDVRNYILKDLIHEKLN